MLTRKEAEFLKNSAYDESYELLKEISNAFVEIVAEREKEKNEIEILKSDLEREKEEQAQAKSRIRELEKENLDLKEMSFNLAEKIKESKRIYEMHQNINAQIKAQENIKKARGSFTRQQLLAHYPLWRFLEKETFTWNCSIMALQKRHIVCLSLLISLIIRYNCCCS